RAEPFLAERLWAHPSQLSAREGDPATELDPAGRPVVTHYEDGGEERYRYDCGGRLSVEHHEIGPVRIQGPRGIVWERCDEPWPELLQRGSVSLAQRCFRRGRSS